jgi:hypothetical protein
MTEEIIKEELSNNYIGALASCAGYMLSKPAHDWGVDFLISGTSVRTEPSGHTRRVSNGKYIEIQLKSTTFARISDYPDYISYPLEAKNYRDLLEKTPLPRILVLFVLPINTDEWVEVDKSSLILRHSAYWYVPDTQATNPANIATVQIHIPKTNRFDVDTWPQLYNKFFP